MKKLQILNDIYGYSTFRKGQEELLDAVISGKDVLGIMPTAAGKSICYQIPALLMEGTTLVISPLISLMKDQVASLTQMGIAAAFLNSSLSSAEQWAVIDDLRGQKIKLLYVAPEQLASERFINTVQQIEIPFIAVDEAHCVSQWGQDFRSSYLSINEFVTKLAHRPVIGAYTATATDLVKEDIIKLLELVNPFILVNGFDRPNLYFAVKEPENKTQEILAYLNKNSDKNGIIYCSTRDGVEQLCAELTAHDFSCLPYHAGLDNNTRKNNQEAFVNDRVNIMVATNAFGMGVDKPNVRFVIHQNMPKNIESYYQEAGRAGRDGMAADCLLLFSGKDVFTSRFFIEKNEENDILSEQEQKQFKRFEYERLNQVADYCRTQQCLRQYILDYFGDGTAVNCNNCSNCNMDYEVVDITVSAQKIISCVKRMRENFGINMVIDVLRGSKNQKVRQNGFEKLSTYGMFSEMSENEVRKLIQYLIVERYLYVADGQFPLLKLGAQSVAVLKNEMQITMRKDMQKKVRTGAIKQKKKQEIDRTQHPMLFEQLQELRYKIASEQSVPAYIVFPNTTLYEMCALLPQSLNELQEISGVGAVKLTKYGTEFLSVIQAYCDCNDIHK
jgi:ATP-dependent DNA helicase RecQ